MAETYLPGAVQRPLSSGSMAGGGGRRAGWHITWDRNATAAAPQDRLSFETLLGYFSGGGAGVAPHILWDPFTGQFAQFHTPTQFSKSFVNAPGGVETNRIGDVMIQIEAVFFPYCRQDGRVYATLADTPCKGLDVLMAWLRSWGIPDVWPMGAPTWDGNRDAAVFASHSGHYGHSQIPENDHTDPGPMPDIFHFGADMPLSSDDLNAIRGIVHAEVTSVDARDNNAMGAMWWLDKALRGVVPDAAQGQPWAQIIPSLHAALSQVSPDVLDALRAAVAQAVAAQAGTGVLHVQGDLQVGPRPAGS